MAKGAHPPPLPGLRLPNCTIPRIPLRSIRGYQLSLLPQFSGNENSWLLRSVETWGFRTLNARIFSIGI